VTWHRRPIDETQHVGTEHATLVGRAGSDEPDLRQLDPGVQPRPVAAEEDLPRTPARRLRQASNHRTAEVSVWTSDRFPVLADMTVCVIPSRAELAWKAPARALEGRGGLDQPKYTRTVLLLQ
jgi:hypothetical protein